MRLFVAILFPEPVRKALMDTMAQMRAQGAHGNFTRPENLHLTLAFLGETGAEGCRAAVRAVDSVCGRAPFSLSLGGAGRFGVLWWAGLQNSTPLAALARDAQAALRAEGFSLDRRPFQPHITLARQVEAPVPLRLCVPRASFSAERISLMRSDRINGVLRYAEIHAASFRGA